MSLNWNGEKPVVDCSGDPGFTVQSQRDEADINKIVQRLQKGANSVRINGKEPFYGDVSDISGLQEALIVVQKSNDLFLQYPAELREKFDNDPVKFVEFMENPDNLDEAIKLGLAEPRPADQPPAPAPEAGQ